MKHDPQGINPSMGGVEGSLTRASSPQASTLTVGTSSSPLQTERLRLYGPDKFRLFHPFFNQGKLILEKGTSSTQLRIGLDRPLYSDKENTVAMNPSSASSRPVKLRDIWETWWPLAGSWMLMGFELPAISAVLARLDNPEIHLAAYGGIVFPISLLIEAPIIMLLAASTALSKDWTSYLLLRRFMVFLAVPLTVIHILVAFTPIFDIVVSDILAAPEEIHEPARIGLMLMTPWTGSIALRRFQQGVLIKGWSIKIRRHRYGHPISNKYPHLMCGV